MRTLLCISLLIMTGVAAIAQGRVRIDSQVLGGSRFVELWGRPGDVIGNKVFYLEFTDRRQKDTSMVVIDSIRFVQCGPGPGSLFFVNDTLGFITENGTGCYMCSLRLYRTEDGGRTWSLATSHECYQGTDMSWAERFFMFDRTSGMIIWQLAGKKLMISTTDDGGISWQPKEVVVDISDTISDIGGVYFSGSGQVTIVTQETTLHVTDEKKVEVLQSNDFGATFKRMGR